MDTFERNVDRLYQSNAFKIDLENPFHLTSGLYSPYYLQCGDLQNYPEIIQGAFEDLKQLVLETLDINDFDRVTGGETRDYIFSIPVALVYLNKPHTMIRKEESTHGTGGKLITTINEGDRCIHIADLRTTGKSEVEEWIPSIRGAKGLIEHSFAYVDRQQGGNDRLAELNPPVTGHALVPVDVEKFFAIGLDEKHITSTQHDELLGYVADPRDWDRRFRDQNPNYKPIPPSARQKK